MKARSKLLNWLPAITVMLVIFLVSSTPGRIVNAIGLGKESYQLGGHFLLFFILCFTYFKATKNAGVSFLLVFLYALTDEFHQKFVLWRSASLKDIFVDLLAGLVAGLILWKLQHTLPKRLKNWLKS